MINPYFSDVPENDLSYLTNADVDKVKFTISHKPAIYQLYRAESGIQVERFNRLGLFRMVSKCEGIATEFVEGSNGSIVVLKGCGPGKVDKIIEHNYDF